MPSRSTVKLENVTITTKHWNTCWHNQDRHVSTQLVNVDPSILHTFNLKLIKTKAIHSSPLSRFEFHFGWLKKTETKKYCLQNFPPKSLKVHFSQERAKTMGYHNPCTNPGQLNTSQHQGKGLFPQGSISLLSQTLLVFNIKVWPLPRYSAKIKAEIISRQVAPKPMGCLSLDLPHKYTLSTS